jgi:nucleotide-binding universal stress UspA family protein
MMIMSGRIVVGLDDSPSSHAALAWAATQARLTNQSLHAVAVLDWAVDARSYNYTWNVLADVGGDLGSEIAAAKSRLQDTFDAIDPEPNWSLELINAPQAGHALVKFAADADLLVVGTRGHTGIDRFVGSVSHYCVSHAHCPVITVPAQAKPHAATGGATAGQSAANE